MSLEVVINGTKEEIGDGMTMLQILKKKNIPIRRTVVEVNGKFIDGANYSSTVIHDGDKIDIINMIGGG